MKMSHSSKAANKFPFCWERVGVRAGFKLKCPNRFAAIFRVALPVGLGKFSGHVKTTLEIRQILFLRMALAVCLSVCRPRRSRGGNEF